MFAEQGDEDLIEAIGRRHENLVQAITQTGLSADSLAEMEDLERVLHNAVIGILRNPLIDSSYRRMHNYLRLLRLDRKLTAPVRAADAAGAYRDHRGLPGARRRSRRSGARRAFSGGDAA